MNDALAFRFAGETDVKTVDFFGLITSINAGIDAPEKAQAFGNVARKALGELIEGKTVEIQQVDKDRYGRVVANVHVGGGLRGGGGG